MSLKDDLQHAARTLHDKLRTVYGMAKAKPDLTIIRAKSFALIQGRLEPEELRKPRRKLYRNKGFTGLRTTNGSLKFNKAYSRKGVTYHSSVQVRKDGTIHWQVMLSIEEAPF